MHQMACMQQEKGDLSEIGEMINDESDISMLGMNQKKKNKKKLKKKEKQEDDDLDFILE